MDSIVLIGQASIITQGRDGNEHEWIYRAREDD